MDQHVLVAKLVVVSLNVMLPLATALVRKHSPKTPRTGSNLDLLPDSLTLERTLALHSRKCGDLYLHCPLESLSSLLGSCRLQVREAKSHWIDSTDHLDMRMKYEGTP